MPELPEVETIVRSLEPLLKGKIIEKIELVKDVVVAYPDSVTFLEYLKGAKIQSLSRRGKFIQILIDSGYTLVIHLRMTGHLIYTGQERPREKHTHVIFYLNDGNQLRFSDTRRFGRLWLIGPEEEDCTGICRLGLEPFSPYFGAEYLKKTLEKRKIVIKQALLDQSVVAGLGNIYVDEVLFDSGITPLRQVNDISDNEWQRLAESIPRILTTAIKNRGTTFSDYLDGNGKRGDNFAYLKAYHREGQACSRCGEKIVRLKIAGRSSYFCPKCQK